MNERVMRFRQSRWIGQLLLAMLVLSGTLSAACRQGTPPAAPPASTVTAGETPASAPPGAQGASGESSAAAGSDLRSTADRYDLGPDEKRGGHTLERHVGRTDSQLRERLKREQQIIAASTYTDRATAERVVARTLAAHRPRVEAWLNQQGDRPNLVLDFHDPDGNKIGRSIERGSPDVLLCEDAIIVLRWGGSGRNFYVLTSYPMATS